MKRFELPEMNISMFDAESVTMLSATGKAMEALEGSVTSTEVTQWSDWTITP